MITSVGAAPEDLAAGHEDGVIRPLMAVRSTRPLPLSASASAVTLGQRLVGSFSSARRMTASVAAESDGCRLDGGGGGSWSCCIATASGDVPWNGTSPVSISNATTPACRTSIPSSTGS